MKAPDWFFKLGERAYMAERRRRNLRLVALLEAQDRSMRAAADKRREAHAAGLCGGYANGCRYYPCYSVRD